MRVFIDTNVWLSGILGHGVCAELLAALIRARAELLICAQVRAEFLRIAQTKFQADEGQLALAEEFFAQACQVVPDGSSTVPGAPHEADAALLAAASAAHADWFVTGDKTLQELPPLGEMQIISPRTAFLRLRGIE